jgi:4-hydroxybutyryl-CoA dehydratase/vinylacetyl-CoA-Delta-isomerase
LCKSHPRYGRRDTHNGTDLQGFPKPGDRKVCRELYVEKYLGGKAGISTEDRLRMLQLIRNWIASEFGGWLEVVAIHAEGSLQAQRMTIYGESLQELQELKERAERLAGIKADKE